MSMHREPLTALEREGLEKHGLPIGAPSQLADSFRLGVRWALQQAAPQISTAHGPWLPSSYDEGETYCKRCLTRSVFADKRACDPHIVYPQPA
jgi:hypothetical protein